MDDSAVSVTELLSSKVSGVGRTMYFVQIVRDEVKRHPTSNYPVVLAVLTLPPPTEPSSTAIGSIKEPTRSQF